MTVTNTASSVTYTGDGANQAFPFSFHIPTTDDIVVELTDTIAETVTALSPSDFDVTGIGDDNGGSVTYPNDGSAAIPSTQKLTIRRVVTPTQARDWTNGAGFDADEFEAAIDRLTMITQQLTEQMGRAFLAGPATEGVNLVLPAPLPARAVKWNAAGDGLVNSTYDPDQVVPAAEAHAAAAEGSANAAAGSAAAAATSEANAALSEARALTYRLEAEGYATSIGQFDVVRVTADTAVTIANNGNLIAVDASAGPVTLTLPLIADAGEPFTVKVKKTDASAHDVTVAPSGTDTIDGQAVSKVLNLGGSGATFSADIDVAPDDWATAAFGASSQLARTEFFFTLTDGQTVISGADDSGRTLAYSPVGLEVYLNGVRMAPADYTATDGASIILTEATVTGAEAHIVATGSFDVADTYTSGEIDAKIAALFPVGSLYFNASNSANPATLLGFGAWEPFGAGRMLIGAGTGTDDNGVQRTFAAGETGGEYDHTLTEAEMPSHTHQTWKEVGAYAAGGTTQFNFNFNGDYKDSGSAGGDQPHNNVQPYLAVYIWQRTA